jgi:hypothetical protein
LDDDKRDESALVMLGFVVVDCCVRCEGELTEVDAIEGDSIPEELGVEGELAFRLVSGV